MNLMFESNANPAHYVESAICILNTVKKNWIEDECLSIWLWRIQTFSSSNIRFHLSSLQLLLLNGNKLSGHLPDERGYLQHLRGLQVDENQISGPIPKSFSNLGSVRHLHLNNNSISGQIPSELSNLSTLIHLLVDNNNLYGYLPSEFSNIPNLRIIQLDNNNFHGAVIPAVYGNLSRLVKLSLRNCSLQGALPNFSKLSRLKYLDLSWNQLTGSIQSDKLSDNMTNMYAHDAIPIKQRLWATAYMHPLEFFDALAPLRHFWAVITWQWWIQEMRRFGGALVRLTFLDEQRVLLDMVTWMEKGSLSEMKTRSLDALQCREEDEITHSDRVDKLGKLEQSLEKKSERIEERPESKFENFEREREPTQVR
ncbi:hypothetical protein POM88_046420 [Heracleum sosnowskyi]|uniref:Uncharacterized protein n=1 Tax=Heracleum sosnowskyi TaxID=360622 RepID=A0AAD8H8U2_9APIA|nr:hypothetical protein POM88_046420 [Heracleum sosnowskyi]